MMSSRFVILGTAGHIDHGKTALVRLLTGTDTDRLKEEKARGISIDLGFAHLDLPGGVSCGVVDVPGHERFVKNMLAGACGVDAMLLVIAADEGVMPQTREHLDILDLLGVTRGVVALTKIDLVEGEWLELVTESVSEYLRERGFGRFPLIPVSAKTGEGRAAVLDALAGAVADIEERTSEKGARLPVDRAFVVEGFGTVVTGTLWRGTVRPGDRLVVEPGGAEARVRKVEVHGREVDAALAGQRTALALAGLSTDQVPRGTWVLSPRSLEPAHMVDVRIRVLPDAPKPLRHRQRIRFHLGASEILGRVHLLEGDVVAPAEEGLAQMRLESPVVADRGDRFVLRSYSPTRAVAGGTVIMPSAPKRRRGRPEVWDELRREESGSIEDRLLALIEGARTCVSTKELARQLGLALDDVEGALKAPVAAGAVIGLDDGTYLAGREFSRLQERAADLLSDFQGTHLLRWGLRRGELKSRLGAGLSAPAFEALIRELSTQGRVLQKGDQLRLGSPDLDLPPELRSAVERVAAELTEGGLKPPSPKELQQHTRAPVAEVLDHLTFVGQAVKVTPELYLSRDQIDRLLGWLETFFQDHARLSVADLKSTWGMSRKYSVPILEHLDREGWTRRQGDVRVPGRRLSG
jgi:selenocysteine-specific elongation factor